MPYIPLYIGDWEQDTNSISLEAEAALLKITFKLWKAKAKGQLQLLFSFSQLSILLKKPQEIALKIVRELQENDVLNIEFLPEEKIKIESRRMIKEALKSKTYSENGAKGGRGKKKEENLNKSKSKAKSKLIPDNDIEYDNEDENEIKLGGTGERGGIVVYSKEQFLTETKNSNWLAGISMNLKIDPVWASEMLNLFAVDQENKNGYGRALGEIKKHFCNWLNLQIEKNVRSTKSNNSSKKASRASLADEASRYLERKFSS